MPNPLPPAIPGGIRASSPLKHTAPTGSARDRNEGAALHPRCCCYRILAWTSRTGRLRRRPCAESPRGQESTLFRLAENFRLCVSCSVSFVKGLPVGGIAFRPQPRLEAALPVPAGDRNTAVMALTRKRLARHAGCGPLPETRAAPRRDRSRCGRGGLPAKRKIGRFACASTR